MSKVLAAQLSDDARWLRGQSGRRLGLIADHMDVAAIVLAKRPMETKAGKRAIEDRSCISDEVLHEQISLAILTATMDAKASLKLRQKIHDSVFQMIGHIFPKPQTEK